MLRKAHLDGLAAAVVAVLMCVAAAPAAAQVVERRDSVDGTLHVAPTCTGFSCIEQPRYSFRVVTEADGSGPQGSITYLTGERASIFGITGDVTCARVSGNRATVAADLDGETGSPGQAPQSVLVFLEDNGVAAADRFLVQQLPLGTAPSTCPGNPPSGASLGPGYPGRSEDDPGVTIVDRDPGPVFKFQCWRLGWAGYGFASRSDCEAFVIRTRALQGSLREFPIPTPNSGPSDIAAGPDGALWFTESNAGKIGRVATGGQFREFALPSANSFPSSITAGPDGALWFVQAGGDRRFGRITTTGTASYFPTGTAGGFAGIAAGSDGALWTTTSVAGRLALARMSTAGAFGTFPVNSTTFGTDIAAGPDGALWFTMYSAGVGRMTTAGQFTGFPVPPGSAGVVGITTGPDGALWFTTEYAARQVGRMTTGGQVTLFPLPADAGLPGSIAAGADGALWFTLSSGQLGRMTPSGQFTALPIPTLDSGPAGIAAGPGGLLFFTERVGKIGRIPARPRSRSRCTRLGWAALGFRSRQACQAFVELLPPA